jgi:hypothetical protein
VFDQAMHWGACVYDWCYPLLDASERQAFITEFERIAALDAPGYPADPEASAVVGHVTEGWLLSDQLPAGVAIYDESPTMYDAAAALFIDRFVEVRDYYYPSHMHHQGDSYASRFAHDQGASWLFRRMGAGDVLSREQQGVPYQLVYSLRPDGQQLRSGDTYDDQGKSQSKRLVSLLTGSYYEDSHLLGVADSELFWSASDYYRVLELLFRPAALTTAPIDELPRTKMFPMPMGEMVARTGWTLGTDSPDTVVQMRIGGTFFGNHQRKDFGTFQIYHRGPLAIASGVYEGDGCDYGCDHWRNYHHQTISQNGLLIFDPNEQMLLHGDVQANDGGERWPADGADHPADLATIRSEGYEVAEVTAWAFGPDPTTPRYSYLAGDITGAYAPAKVTSVTRAWVTFTTGDATFPAIVVGRDRVVATSADFPKTWLLHSIEEPSVEARTVSVVRQGPTWDGEGAYGGKLVVESLLPEEATITTVGGPGYEFWVPSTATSYAVTKGGAAEPGAWRVEIAPSAAAMEDSFLEVMTVMASDEPAGPTVTRLEATGMVGASADGWAALFSASGELLQSTTVTLAGAAAFHVLVADLSPGYWYVRADGEVVAAGPVTEEGRCLYFESGPGSYDLAPGEPPDGGAGAGGTGAGGGAGTGGSGLLGNDLALQPGETGGCGCRLASRRDRGSAGVDLLLATAVLGVRRRKRG